MKKQNNDIKHLAKLLTDDKITFEQFLFRSKADELNINTWKCWDCNTNNTHNIDDFGFCKDCLQSQ
tara:strand:- start:415 stop:612 length:198 start_codon:yes stop_codon:yes gene_type:complete